MPASNPDGVGAVRSRRRVRREPTPAPRGVTGAFGGASSQRPFAGQQAAAARTTERARERLPRATIAVPPIIANPTVRQIRAAKAQLVRSVRTAVGTGGTAHDRRARHDALLHDIATDPRYAAARRSINHWTQAEARLIDPTRRVDTVKAGPAPKRARLGVGPLNLGTVNVTAATEAARHAVESATPGLQVGDGPGQFARNALKDVGTLAEAPFVGAVGIAGLGADVVTGHPERAARKAAAFGKGVVESTVQEVKHPEQAFLEHPLLTTLDFAGLASVGGRVAGAVARGAGSTVEAAGVRGSLARAGSTVRPPLALTDEPGGPIKQRTYSKDLTRKRAQVAADRRREPLTHPDGTVVTVHDRGHEVPVLRSRTRSTVRHPAVGERAALQDSRGDVVASRANMRERLVREQAGAESKVQSPSGAAAANMRARIERGAQRVLGVSGRDARDLVQLAVEGTIRSAEHFTEDLRQRRADLERAWSSHDARDPTFADLAEMRANRDQAALIDRVLASPKATRQAQKIMQSGMEHGGRLVAREAEAHRRGLFTRPAEALERRRLMPTAITHMGARHFSEAEHQAMERAARADEARAAEEVHRIPSGPAHDQAEAAYVGARARRIAVSGRDPERVAAHEDAVDAVHDARDRLQRAVRAQTQAEGRVQRLTGATAVHRGQDAQRAPVAAYYVGDHRFVRLADAVKHARAEGLNPRSAVRRVATSAAEARRVGELSSARRAARAALTHRRAAEKQLRLAEHAVRANPMPATRAGLRYGERSAELGHDRLPGESLPTADIREHLTDHGRDPETIAYLPHVSKALGARAFHAPLRPGTRGTLDAAEGSTGELYSRGAAHVSADLIHEQGVRQATALTKADEVDALVAEHGLKHPAFAKSARGEKLTDAERAIVDERGYWTAKEAADTASRLSRDTATGRPVLEVGGDRFVPMRAFGAKLSEEAKAAIDGEWGGPAGMESLGERLLNDRIVQPEDFADGHARNVVLVPADLVSRLEKHLRPAGELQKLAQVINRAFRLAVLPQPRWIAGNFIEPFFVRLAVVGSGVNVFGLAVDLRAANKVLAELRAHADSHPEFARALEQVQAQQFGGLLFGGRGATVHRGLDDFPAMIAMLERTREIPAIGQFAELTGRLLKGGARVALAPLHAIFAANRAMEMGLVDRASFGHQIRHDVQEITGSWIETLRVGQAAAEDAARGLTGTPTQERFLRAQHELLGQYDTFDPRTRAIVQSIAPFAPWAMSAARFVFWTMPAHHTALTALLIKTNEVMSKDWDAMHADAPPGGLQLAVRTDDGGFVDLARYTPWGLTGPAAEGDLGAITSQVLPQLSGAQSALEGQDPFGRELRVPRTPENPSGRATVAQKIMIALNAALESGAPYASTVRRLQEHGETAWPTSNLLHPKTKPGTGHGMSAARRTFDPFRPTYLRGGVAPVPTRAPRGGTGGGGDLPASVQRALAEDALGGEDLPESVRRALDGG